MAVAPVLLWIVDTGMASAEICGERSKPSHSQKSTERRIKSVFQPSVTSVMRQAKSVI